MQKLLIIERDTKDELQRAIEKNILQQKNMRLITFSVLQTTRLNDDNMAIESNEAWCVISVPDKTDEFYNDLTGMSE